MKRTIIFPLFFLIATSKTAFACPLCKDAVAKMGEIWTSIGFNWSILFMLAVPSLMVGSFVFILYRNYRKFQRTKA